MNSPAELAARISALEADVKLLNAKAPAITDTTANQNQLPVNTDQTSAQLRGNAAQDPNRAPNPQTNVPTEPVASRPTVGPVGPRV